MPRNHMLPIAGLAFALGLEYHAFGAHVDGLAVHGVGQLQHFQAARAFAAAIDTDARLAAEFRGRIVAAR